MNPTHPSGQTSKEGASRAACLSGEPISDPDRHGRRAVWIAALITMIGAGMIYADKAAEDRSAFVRWRHQVLEMMAGSNIYDKYYFPNPPIMPLTLYPLMALPPVEGGGSGSASRPRSRPWRSDVPADGPARRPAGPRPGSRR